MRQVLKRPILTEKSSLLGDKGQYVFEVIPTANKIEIRKAVEERYNVQVTDVRTITVKPKTKIQMTRRGYVLGKTSKKKKAVVSLKQGQKIDMIGDLPPEE